ncbi:MAG: enoyl-CoA hydratase [Desulfuromonas sp.]|nr:MAG: enoyl-CoA hydratase [Desulfuromonas sp.]
MANAVARLLETLTRQLGTEVHVGEWLKIDQKRIDLFAEVTGDRQWIHIDPQRAESESPYKSTIAHGYLTLSLLPFLSDSNSPERFMHDYPGMRLRINYGLNRVRFPSPVKVHARIRARTTLVAAAAVGEGVEVIHRYTVDIEGQEKPACVAEFVARLFP